MSLAEWRRDRLEQAAREGEIVKLTGPRSIATPGPAPFQPHRVELDTTTTDNRYPQTLGQFDEDIAEAVLEGRITLRRARATQHERESHRVYIEVAGCGWPAPSDDLCGTVVGFTRNRTDCTGPVARAVTDGVFVRLDARPAMLYIEVGEHVGSRGQHAEILSWREIDRDEYDRLTGIAEVRNSMGWTW